MKNLIVLFLLFLLPLSSSAQLTVADRYDVYQPIVVGCNCIVPENGAVQFMWQVDSGSNYIVSDDSKRIYIWAPPGIHTVEAVVATTVFQEILVWVPDPKFPTDITKAILKTVKTLQSFDVQRYNKSYLVGSAPPTPPPGPVPPGPVPPGPVPPGPIPPGPVPPGPLGGFAGKCYTWLKAVPASNYSKDKALKVAGNFDAIAAQAVATSGWNLSAFVNQTKIKNQETFTPADAQAWGVPFFNPLAAYQAELFAARKLTVNDTTGIAQLWKDTAEAIRAAANAVLFTSTGGGGVAAVTTKYSYGMDKLSTKPYSNLDSLTADQINRLLRK